MPHDRISSSRSRLAAALVAAAVGAATLATGAGAVAGAAPPGSSPGASAQVLAERMHGEAAISALGDRLPEVAERNGLTAADLTARLRADDALWVDEHGALLFVDDVLADRTETSTDVVTDPSWVTHPPSAAFTLHSRPGADRVIHLDFDGHDPATSGWKSKTYAQPYDTDRDPTSFSDSERRAVIEVWQRVAEDFAPFAIDVTTEDPGIDAIRRTTSGDLRYGTRVAVTPTATNCDGCGGVAYVGTYDVHGGSATTGWTHDLYQPAWVYLNGSSAKSIAEAASHEAGHNLGLSHDGTSTLGYYQGHGDWAPLMGVGYYEEVTQWSRGEYGGASNKEDDFAVVDENGGSLAADDHGGTVSTATPLDVVVDVLGEIGAGGDVDAFSFTTAGGTLRLAASPTTVGPNLDIALRLLRDTGSVVASVDVAGLGASIDTTLAAGTYTLMVDGVGAGDPATTGYSDYGSVGRYHLTGQLPSGEPVANRAPSAAIGASTTAGAAPLPVTFDGSSSSDPDGDTLTHSWTFGDGSTASGARAEHSYDTPGTYTATLTVSDGALEHSASITITVREPATVVAAPAAPNLLAEQSGGVVILDWTDVASVSTYDVYRESQHRNGSFRGLTLLGTTPASTSTWTDEPGSGTFRYHVVARGAGGDTPSNELVLTVSGGSNTGGKPGGKGATKPGAMKVL